MLIQSDPSAPFLYAETQLFCRFFSSLIFINPFFFPALAFIVFPLLPGLSMRKTRNPFRRNRVPAPAIENIETNLTLEVTLKCGERGINGLCDVPNHDLIAVATDKVVYVYEYSTGGDPIRVFKEHKSYVRDVIHLGGDILASVDSDGMLLTWRARTGPVLSQLKVSEKTCKAITKASASEILITTKEGEIVLVGHENGNNLTEKNRYVHEETWDVSVYDDITWDVSMYDDILVGAVKSLKGGARICNYVDGRLLHTIENLSLIHI